jgi:hypothetical protein
MTESLARKLFTDLKDRTGTITDAELDEFWATLEPATVDFMMGEWKGGAFNNGHPLVGGLTHAGWFGKTFNSPGDVQPLVCLDENGDKFSNVSWARAKRASGSRSSAAR